MTTGVRVEAGVNAAIKRVEGHGCRVPSVQFVHGGEDAVGASVVYECNDENVLAAVADAKQVTDRRVADGAAE